MFSLGKASSVLLGVCAGLIVANSDISSEDIAIKDEMLNHYSMPSRINDNNAKTYFLTPLMKNKYFNMSGGQKSVSAELDDLFRSNKKNQISIELGNTDQRFDFKKNSWHLYVQNKNPNSKDYVFDNVLSYGFIKDFSPSDILKLRTSAFSEWNHMSSETNQKNIDYLINSGIIDEEDISPVNNSDINTFTIGLHNLIGLNSPKININDKNSLSFGVANSTYGEVYFSDSADFSGIDCKSIIEAKYGFDGLVNFGLKLGLENVLTVESLSWNLGLINNKAYVDLKFDNKVDENDSRYFVVESNNSFNKGYFESDNSFNARIKKLKFGLNQKSSTNTWDEPVINERMNFGGEVGYIRPFSNEKISDLSIEFNRDITNDLNKYGISINIDI